VGQRRGDGGTARENRGVRDEHGEVERVEQALEKVDLEKNGPGEEDMLFGAL